MQLHPGVSQLSDDPERSTGMSAASLESSSLRLQDTLSLLVKHSFAGIAPRKLRRLAET